MAYEEIWDFLSTASIEGKSRSWMQDDRRRPRQSGSDLAPVHFAYNTNRPGICLLVVMTDRPFVTTVVTRAEARQRDRRREEMMATRPSKRHRIINTGS